MNAGNDISKLFHPIDYAPESTEALISILEEYGSRRLVYPSNGFRNIGYIFRGEIGFDVPLQSSLEREWFKVNGGNECTVDDLISFEKNLVERFMQEAREIRDLARRHKDERSELPLDRDVFEWLQLKQHYRTKTRLLDFTREIHIALYFALEHFCQINAKLREKGLIIYCFPCVDIENPKTGNDNKSPFNDNNKDSQPDINWAIGGQMKLECMKLSMIAYEQRYCRAKQKQSFGWDQAYHPNPRLSFQEGMLAYPFSKEGVAIKECGPSWFVQCLRLNQDDPFHLGSTQKCFQPVAIHIRKESVNCCLEYVQNILGL